MSNMVDFFTLPDDEMITRGDFLSSMFVVMAGGCVVSYFLLGYGTNTVAQVRPGS
jgi:ATP-binding cassette subfamily B (MDR/TAP) protein 1